MSSQCPLCEQNNQCQVNNPEGCWCFSANLTADDRSEAKKRMQSKKLAYELREKSCICQACLQSIKKSTQF